MMLEGWVYDRYLIEAAKIDQDVQTKQVEINSLGELQMTAARGK